MDCQFCGRPGAGPYCLTPPAPGVPSCEDCAREAGQLTFVEGLHRIAAGWLGPMPGDLPDLDPLPARLQGVVFSLLPALEGDGSLPPHRLSPQGHPDTDLIAYHVHERWPDTNAGDPFVRTLLRELATLLRVAEHGLGRPIDAMGGLLRSVCQLLEDRYELRPLDVDEGGHVIGEGPDIAAGLTPTFTAAWASTPLPAVRAAVVARPRHPLLTCPEGEPTAELILPDGADGLVLTARDLVQLPIVLAEVLGQATYFSNVDDPDREKPAYPGAEADDAAVTDAARAVVVETLATHFAARDAAMAVDDAVDGEPIEPFGTCERDGSPRCPGGPAPLVVDPYNTEVNGEIVHMYLHEPCAQERAYDA